MAGFNDGESERDKLKITGSMTFARAAEVWLSLMDFPATPGANAPRAVRFISRRSLDDLRCYIRALSRFFGGYHLECIKAADLRRYQEQRASGELSGPERPGRKRGACGARINQEINCLIRIMRRAGLWESLSEDYLPLHKEESDVGRALTPQEQEHWLTVAASRPRWAFVYHYSVVALATCLSTHEMRGLRFSDIDPTLSFVMVRAHAAKNKYRIRTVPVDPQAVPSLRWLMERGKRLGATAPNHFIMPFRRQSFPRRTDPDVPMTVSGIKRHWNEVRKEAGLEWLRPNDMRHSGITRRIEAGVPVGVVMDAVGHSNPRMTRHYTHLSMAVKRQAFIGGWTEPHQALAATPQANGHATEKAGISIADMVKALRTKGLPADQILGIVEALSATA